MKTKVVFGSGGWLFSISILVALAGVALLKNSVVESSSSGEITTIGAAAEQVSANTLNAGYQPYIILLVSSFALVLLAAMHYKSNSNTAHTE